MTPPRLEACYFDRPGHHEFARMARVLEWTAAAHCPEWSRTIRTIPMPPRAGTGNPGHVANTSKLEVWVETMRQSTDGDRILFLDVDTCILRPLDEIWDRAFDLAYAGHRRGFEFPFNLGVVFVRVSVQTRAFFEEWQDENRRLFHGDDVATWRAKYGGVNQAAFGSLLERGALDDLTRLDLTCREWNCEESAWAQFDPARTRILHLKGALRRAIFHGDPVTLDLASAATYWHALEGQVSPAERRRA